MDTAASYQRVARREEESLLSRIRRTARERVSAAAFSWLEFSLAEIVLAGAEYQRRNLPVSLRKAAHIDLRAQQVHQFARERSSRLLGSPGLVADAEVSLALRPRTVARTEVNAALFFGRHELIRQLIARGAIRPEQITREWVARLDERTRDSHVSLHGQWRPWGVPFISPLSGVFLDHPHDSSAPASEVVNCRCSEIIRVLV